MLTSLVMALCLWAPLDPKSVVVVAISPNCTAFRLDYPQLNGLQLAGIQVVVHSPESKRGQLYIARFGLRTVPYYILFINDPNDREQKYRPVTWGSDIRCVIDYLRLKMRVAL